jgi:hypothetical protein
MTDTKRLPTPEQIQIWLRARGWTPEKAPPADPEDGIDFTYKDRSDDGQEIWVRVPRTSTEPPWYPLSVRSVIVTAAGMEDRPEADVLAEMLAINPAHQHTAPRTPPVPAT